MQKKKNGLRKKKNEEPTVGAERNQRSAAAGKAKTKTKGNALKGQHSIAQGNALGNKQIGKPAP